MDATADHGEVLPWLGITEGFLSLSENAESTASPARGLTRGEDTLTDVVNFLDRYYLPILIVLGVLGNLVSIAVFLSAYLRQLSLSVYLSALAFSDTVFLLSLAMGWMEYSGMPLFHQPGWCQVTVYISYASSFLSSWFVVSFTVERYIAICYPLRRPEMCTSSRAKYVVSGLTVVGVVGFAFTTWTTGTLEMKNSTVTVCMPLEEYYNVHLVTTYVDLIISLIIPFTAILILNVKIAYTLRIFSKRNAKARGAGIGTWNRTHEQITNIGNRAQVNITKLLLIISTVFLVINLPSYAMRIRMFVMAFKLQKQKTVDNRIQQLVQFVYYLNYGINFYLYSLWSRRFRQGLVRMVWQARYNLRSLVEKSYRLFRGSSIQMTQVDLGVMPLQQQQQQQQQPRQNIARTSPVDWNKPVRTGLRKPPGIPSSSGSDRSRKTPRTGSSSGSDGKKHSSSSDLRRHQTAAYMGLDKGGLY